MEYYFQESGLRRAAGVGLHTSIVLTPRPILATAADLLEYRQQFLNGLKSAIDTALMAQPQYLIMGMSLEHIISGIEEIRLPMTDIEMYSGLSWATWHDAAPAALQKFGAKRIGLLTPFDKQGNENAARMFEDLGYTVVSSVGFPARMRCILPIFLTGLKKKRLWNCWQRRIITWMPLFNVVRI